MPHHMKPWFRTLFVSTLLLFSTQTVFSGEPDQAQPYEKIRYPTFAEGRLRSLLEADQAEAYDITEDTPRINLVNVVITMYDDSAETIKNTPDDQELPVKMVITSDRGYFTRRPPEPGSQPEEIAHLEGNVILRQMRLPPPPPEVLTDTSRRRRLSPAVETEIHCQQAQWNNTLRKLNGDGEVEFIQEDSRIVGDGFLYLADDEAMHSGSSSSNIKNWGGIIFIEHNARMEIDREERDGATGRTEITCLDTASYKLREREIQFERDVKIRRADLLIESDILKVFLRAEDEIDTSRSAGQVRSIVATIGKRPGSVVITGLRPEAGSSEPVQFVARGGRADYDLDTNRITLTDTRPELAPRVEFGRDRISDRTLEFVFSPASEVGADTSSLLSLNASGGQGRVFLQPKQEGGQAAPTEVSYRGEMNYSRSEGRIRLQDQVYLAQGDLRIKSEILDVHMLLDENGQVTNRLSRAIAENEVEIETDGRKATARRAEYDVDYDAGLDVLKLFGPPQGTPPHPTITDEKGHQITAPQIDMRRLARTTAAGRTRHLLRAGGGVAVCSFYTAPDNLADKGKTISIQCDSGMEYNEATQVAWFEGHVVATSDDTDDDYILTSDRLIINLLETPHPTDAGETTVRLRRIHASKNARLTQALRVCEANEIIRDFPTDEMRDGDIYLEGAPAADGRPPQMAVYREQDGANIGALFAAPRIMAAARGNLIRANGPGHLSMPDDMPGQRSEIHFEGAARYESFHEGMASEAKFRRGVVLRQPSRMFTLNAEELDTRFLKDPVESGRDDDDDDVSIDRIGQLRRAEARVGVKVEHGLPRQGRRVAIGDRGIIEFTPSGNVISLSADRSQDKNRFVMARDHDGLTLRAPDIEVREAQGVTRASGPGDLQIPGDSNAEGLSKVPTRVLYGERGMLVYNELALNIKVSDNVRIVQPGVGNNWSFPSLDGRCDRMEISLLEPPVGGMTGNDALSRVLRMDALGAVLLRVYADPPPDNPNIDWLQRPGTTFFTRGDQGVYYVPEGRIEISALPGRQPQLLLNMVDVGRPPRRQRLKADRFILNTNTMPRRWTFAGDLESSNLREDEPFEFQN